MSVPTNLLSANAESVETDIGPWNAGPNTTLAWSTRFYTGSHSLGMTAIATGTVTATLANRVAVTAGTVYQAYAYFAAVTAGSGRTATVQIDWYSASVGGTPISSSSGSVSLDATTAWNTPPPQVTATAPAGAQYASLTVSVSGVTAGQQMCADRFTLGEPYNVASNLLPYTSASMEADTGGWTALTNATVGRSQPLAMEGWYSLTLTSVAAGGVEVGSIEVPVTAGAEYQAGANVLHQTLATSVRVDIRWYDATSTQVGVTTGRTWSLTANTWGLVKTVGTAPAGATKARVVIAPTATASGQTWLADLIAIIPTSAVSVPGNLIPYAVSDMETGVDDWVITGGTATPNRTTIYSVAYSMAVVADGGDLSISLTTDTTTPIVAGQSYQLKAPLHTSSAIPFTTQIEWLDSTGSALRTRYQSWSISDASDWYWGPTGDIAPAGAVSVRVAILYTGLAAGTTIYVDRVQLTPGGLTVAAVPAGGGGVALTVNGLTTASPSWVWSLTRVDSSGHSAAVRGWTGDLTSQAITGDVAVATDYETPLGVPVQWRITVKDPAGPSRRIYTSDAITLDATPTDVWLKDPGLPARSVQLTVATPMPTWQRAARQGVSQVRGRQLPVVISDARAGKTGTLTVVTETDDDVRALWWVLETGNTLLLQWPPGWGEDDIYVSVGDVQAAPVVDYAEFSDRTWSLPLTQVDRPIGGITGSADRTWQTVKDSGTTWADVLAGADSWLDIYTGA